ncbi:hypothetical protein ACN47E_001882 [Coniothyrium glycines]
MPPRPRGRASARARGSGRGGTVAGQATAGAGAEAADATLLIPNTTSTGPEPQSVVPKEETADETIPSVRTEALASTAEPQVSPPTSASADTVAQNASETPSRAPVARIGSLQGSVPPSRSASPSIRGRGSATRGKRGMIKPSFTGRRSKEERDAMAEQAKERELLRNAERDAAELRKQRDAERAAKREANKASKARGGYSGAISGPFSLGSSREDRKNNPNRGVSSFGSGSGSRAVRVKNENDGSYSGSGHSGGGGGSGGGRSNGGGEASSKREDGGYVSSSDEEEDKAFPRKDIDTIELSSDEDDGKDSVVPVQRHRATLPVRIGRKEHQERAFGINTDTSAETSTKTSEQAVSAGQKLASAAPEPTSRKSKSKPKDMEITGERKPFRGVWQDADDAGITVKTEIISDDENMDDAEQLGIASSAAVQVRLQDAASRDAERKVKVKGKTISEPILQTEEDRAEWARFQTNMQHIRAELGPEENTAIDASGDAPMAESSSNVRKPTVRDNNVYLFQIPPLMPELLPPAIKNEPLDGHLSAPPAAPVSTQAPKSDSKVKLEEGGFSDPNAKPKEGPRFASGMVGKLRVRQSGRTTLDWGGTSYELTPGNRASFLQEVVSINIVPERNRIAPEEAGDAISFGRVKGKFVVVPDWTTMLG